MEGRELGADVLRISEVGLHYHDRGHAIWACKHPALDAAPAYFDDSALIAAGPISVRPGSARQLCRETLRRGAAASSAADFARAFQNVLCAA